MGKYSGYLALAAMFLFAALTLDRWSGEAAVAPEREVAARESASEVVRYSRAPAERYRAIDGDSLRSGSDDVRIRGIDAPELSQTCRDGSGREWACGREASARLRALVASGPVHCASGSRDRYGRALARCSAGAADIGETMVREGLAVDFMQGGYKAAEAEARADKRGIWSGAFERPQEYRRQHPRRADRPAS
jgi:endonuclease YncB( thermonuclease family)